MKLRVHTYIVVLLFLSQHSPLFYVFFRNEMNLNHRYSYNNGKIKEGNKTTKHDHIVIYVDNII